MSTTTDLARGAGLVALVLTGWIGLLATTLRLAGAGSAPAVLVLGLPGALPDGAALLARAGPLLTVTGEAGLVRALYAAGAWIVLPAGLVGCVAPDAPPPGAG